MILEMMTMQVLLLAEPVFLLTPPQIMKQNLAIIFTSMPMMEPIISPKHLPLLSQILTKHPVILT